MSRAQERSNLTQLITTLDYTSTKFIRGRSIKVSSSLDNEYIPFMSLFNAEFLIVRDKSFNIYSIPKEKETSFPANRASHFVSYISDYVQPQAFTKNNMIYYIGKHMIYRRVNNGEYEILYMLCMKSDYLGTIQINNLDVSKFVMVVNTAFVHDPGHRLMYNVFKKECYLPLTELSIDTVYTSDIDKWCFKDFSISLEFSTIADMKNYNKQITKEVINEIINCE